jgi:hypothetical protein
MGYLGIVKYISTALLVWDIVFPQQAAAYVDPGTTGMLSQVLYVLFYGILGLVFYLLRYINQYFANAKRFLAKIFARRT